MRVRINEEVQFIEFAKNSEPAKKIANIQFSLLRPSDIQKTSQIPIINRDIYHFQSLIPFRGGPLDQRLGISEKGKSCQTCHKDQQNCPGHFGYECSKVLLSESDKMKYLKKMRQCRDSAARQKLFKTIIDACKKSKKCPYCDSYNGTVKKRVGQLLKIDHDKFNQKSTSKDQDMEQFIKDFETSCTLNKDLENVIKKSYEDLDPQKVYNMFVRISDEDTMLLDMDSSLCKPSDMIITQMPAPPVCIRPSVPVSHNTTNEDDLTVKLAEIIQINNLIKISIEEGLPTNKLIEDWNLMQYTIAQYFNSEAPGLPLNLLGTKQIRGMSQRLKGKHGRFRQNLSGKRVDFTGRTVISPDPNCAIDEVMVPQHMAMILTYPERANLYNLERLRGLVRTGPGIHPGANYVEYGGTNGEKSFLQFGNRKKIADELKIGDVVERHLENGDVVLFNRQPSLHRVSIMAHKVRVMPSKSLRFNECVCTPYNADFDGDEMNIHVPQTEEARAEARVLMDVKQNLLIPRSGEPLVAATQDFLTTSYLITQKDVFLNRNEFMKVCAYFNDANERIELPPPSILKPIELWTGKQVINVLLRPNRDSNVYVNTVVRARNYSGKGEQMCVNDGWVIFQNSELICGNLCKTTMGSGSKNGLFYSLIRDNSSEVAAMCMLRVAKFSSRWLSNYGMSIGIGDVTPFQKLIEEQANLLAQGEKNCNELIQKFKLGNLELKAGCNAEQTLEARMNGELSQIRDKAGDILKKSLPKHNSPLIMAVCGSKGSNINLCQMIACVGQQTVNGCRMPNGFIDRSLPHFVPHSKYPAAKGFVKNSFYSGLTATEFFFHTVGGREGLVDTAVKTAETGYMQRRLMKALEDLSAKYDYTVRTCSEDIVQFQYGDDGLDPMYMDDNNQPVSLNRLFTIIKENTKQSLQVMKEHMLFPGEIEHVVTKAINNCPVVGMSSKFLEQLHVFFDLLVKEIVRVRSDLSLKDGLTQILSSVERKKELADASLQRLLRNFPHITQSQFDQFIELVWLKYRRSLITPGEAVGAVAAQSLGEPTTQMTLKTFHFAGVASMNITLGVPRIKEIINATKEISTPIITAKLFNEEEVVSARIVKGRIEKTILGDICKYIKEVYTPRGCYLSIKVDQNTIDALKLEIDINTIVKSILSTPKMKVKEKNIQIIKRDKLHIEPYDTSRDKMYFVMQGLKNMLPNVIVKGIPTIIRAVISKLENDESKYQLLVEGQGLKEVMRVDGVDFRHTKSNHVIETEKVLGIEAARQTIVNEIKYTMQQHGMSIDIRHMNLVADVMTFKGQVLGITRFGVQRMKSSTLMLASFEKTTDHLYDSAVNCKQDDISGVSESIIMGNLIPVGTGLFKLVYDQDMKPSQNKKVRSSTDEKKKTGSSNGNISCPPDIDYYKIDAESLLFDKIQNENPERK